MSIFSLNACYDDACRGEGVSHADSVPTRLGHELRVGFRVFEAPWFLNASGPMGWNRVGALAVTSALLGT